MQGDSSTQKRKVAIVTGAAHRIGACTCRRLHEQGYNVLVHYRASEAAALELINELNDKRDRSASGVQANLLQSETAEQLVEAAIKEWGRLDLLVNNASEFFPTRVGEITKDHLDTLFTTNVSAPLLLAQASLHYLKKHSGCVVNIVDIYSEIVHREHSSYSASKAALAMLTKSLAVEFAPEVRVNGVSPGAILWPEGNAELSDDRKKTVLEKIPLQRKGNAIDVADAVLYLANAEYVTGQLIKVDGGRTL